MRRRMGWKTAGDVELGALLGVQPRGALRVQQGPAQSALLPTLQNLLGFRTPNKGRKTSLSLILGLVPSARARCRMFP